MRSMRRRRHTLAFFLFMDSWTHPSTDAVSNTHTHTHTHTERASQSQRLTQKQTGCPKSNSTSVAASQSIGTYHDLTHA